jgi:transposase
MPRYTTVAPHVSVADLGARYRQSHDPVERSHWQALWLVAQGRRVPDVAAIVGDTPDWVRTIIRRDNAAGPVGIVDGRHANPGTTPLLTQELREALRTALRGPSPDGGLWTARKVATWMAERLGRPVGEVRGWEAMRALGFTPQRPRPRATAADPVAQAAFKKGDSKIRLTPSEPLTRPRS